MEKLFNNLQVTSHTDYIQKGATFVALSGFNSSGLNFIPLALEKGASKIVVQKDVNLSDEIKNLIIQYKAELVIVDNARIALAEMATQAYGHPANKLKIVGVTGTKGKTTTTFLLHHILTANGYRTALITGVYNVINGIKFACDLTTPQADYLQAFLAECVKQNVKYVFMEASAHAFTLHRLHGIKFSGAIFTNLDLEHLEFYKDMEEYFQAKAKIIGFMQKDAPIIVNADNAWCKIFLDLKKDATSFSLLDKLADSYASNLVANNTGQNFKLNVGNNVEEIHSSLIGTFNSYNIGMAATLAHKLGLPLSQVSNAIKTFDVVPGRMEKVRLANGALVVIDYAHNPLSYNSVLPELKKICKELVVVFGAGGDRDSSRRPLMGEAASKWADKIVITSDNPRSEDAQTIANQICAGMPNNFLKNVTVELDRKKAIELACKNSTKDTVIAILGKGPDNYQIIGSRKFYFSDKEEVSCFL